MNSITNEKSTSKDKSGEVYLSHCIMYETCFGIPTKNINGICIIVSITNTSQEICFYDKPTFKASVPFEGKTDFYIKSNKAIESVQFPVKLKFGEKVSVSYKLTPCDIDKFEDLLSQDANAIIKAIVSTLQGERIESNSYEVAKLVKDAKYVKYDTDISELLLWV